MRLPRLITVGAAAVALSVVLAGLALRSPAGASAQQPPCATVVITVRLSQVASTNTPTATSTVCPPQIVHSATPTFTPTSPATATPVPATPAPTQPAPTATATKPSGGTGAQVTAPNTGSGSAAGSGYNWYLLLAAVAVAAMGGGSFVVAARRARRG